LIGTPQVEAPDEIALPDKRQERYLGNGLGSGVEKSVVHLRIKRAQTGVAYFAIQCLQREGRLQ
jgi:hypothetical protein